MRVSRRRQHSVRMPQASARTDTTSPTRRPPPSRRRIVHSISRISRPSERAGTTREGNRVGPHWGCPVESSRRDAPSHEMLLPGCLNLNINTLNLNINTKRGYNLDKEKLSQLQIWEYYKYSELCALLGEPEKQGNSKKAQEKNGHAILNSRRLGRIREPGI